MQHLLITRINALVHADIDQGIHEENSKVSQNEKKIHAWLSYA